MAKKPKANSHDNTVKNMIISFCVIIFIVGTLLVWNNYTLSYAGTVDGERMPVTHLNFYQNQAWDTLLWQIGMMPGPETEEWAMEIAYDSLIELHLTASRAADFGFSLADVDADNVDERMDMLRLMHERPDMDVFAAMGFSNRSFRRFVELQALHELVYEHIISMATVDEQEKQEAFEQFWAESFTHYTDVLVHLIEVETQDEANAVIARTLGGENFVDLMRELSVSFDEESLQYDDDGQPILTQNIEFSILAEWGEHEHIALAYGMEEGEISMPISIAGGNWVIFEVAEIFGLDEDEMVQLEEDFKHNHEMRTRDEYFRERFEEWKKEANIVPNGRVLPGF